MYPIPQAFQQDNKHTIYKAVLHIFNQQLFAQEQAEAKVNDSESAMTVEARLLREFMDNILPNLKQHYGALTAEDLLTVRAEICYFLWERLDKLEPDSGERACRDPRARQEYDLETNKGCYHTALRILYTDNNTAGYYRNFYFNGAENFSYQGMSVTYLELLGYLWKAASDPHMEPSEIGKNFTPELLVETSIENFLSVLAEIRRAHNYDDDDLLKSPFDHQSCPIGVRGRIIARMGIYNKITGSSLSLEAIYSEIQKNIIEQLENLPVVDLKPVIEYLDNKMMLLDMEPDSLPYQGMSVWIAGLAGLKKRIVDDISKIILETDRTEYYLLREKLTKGNSADQNKLMQSQFYEIVARMFDLQVGSLSGDNQFPVENEFMIKILRCGIKKISEQAVVLGLEGMQSQLRSCYKMVKTAKDMWDNEQLRQRLCPAYAATEIAQFKVDRFAVVVGGYLQIYDEIRAHIKTVLDSQQAAIRTEIATAAVLMDEKTQEHISANILWHDTDLQSKEAAIANIRNQMLLCTQTSFQADNLSFVVDLAVPIPCLLARRIFELVLAEHEQRGYEYHSVQERDEIDRYLDLIFGNRSLNIVPMPVHQRDRVLFELNRLFATAKDQSKLRWGFLDEKIKKYSAPTDSNHAVSLVAPRYFYDREAFTLFEARVSLLNRNERIGLDSYPDTKLSLICAPESKSGDDQPQAWEVAANTVYAAAGIEGLHDFVLQTIINNLQIHQMHRKDSDIIKAICNRYLNEVSNYSQPLPFTTEAQSTKEALTRIGIHNIRKHLSILLTTLNHPEIKRRFVRGDCRLMSSEEALYSLSMDYLSYPHLLRISNSDPQEVILQTCNQCFYLLREKRNPDEQKSDKYRLVITEEVPHYQIDGEKYAIFDMTAGEMNAFIAQRCGNASKSIFGTQALGTTQPQAYQSMDICYLSAEPVAPMNPAAFVRPPARRIPTRDEIRKALYQGTGATSFFVRTSAEEEDTVSMISPAIRPVEALYDILNQGRAVGSSRSLSSFPTSALGRGPNSKLYQRLSARYDKIWHEMHSCCASWWSSQALYDRRHDKLVVLSTMARALIAIDRGHPVNIPALIAEFRSNYGGYDKAFFTSQVKRLVDEFEGLSQQAMAAPLVHDY